MVVGNPRGGPSETSYRQIGRTVPNPAAEILAMTLTEPTRLIRRRSSPATSMHRRSYRWQKVVAHNRQRTARLGIGSPAVQLSRQWHSGRRRSPASTARCTRPSRILFLCSTEFLVGQIRKNPLPALANPFDRDQPVSA